MYRPQWVRRARAASSSQSANACILVDVITEVPPRPPEAPSGSVRSGHGRSLRRRRAASFRQVGRFVSRPKFFSESRTETVRECGQRKIGNDCRKEPEALPCSRSAISGNMAIQS